MRSVIRALAVGVVGCVLACAQTTGTQRSAGTTVRGGQSAAERRVKLAVLPVDSDYYPKVASTINGLFRDVQVQGIDDYFMSKVTLEVVQLSIECVESSSACYTAVGRSLASNRLLLAQVTPLNPPPPGKPRKRDKNKEQDTSLKITITYFNVDDQTPSNVVDHTFKSEDEAAGGLCGLIQKGLQATLMSAQSPR